jgi:hypothetical protein
MEKNGKKLKKMWGKKLKKIWGGKKTNLVDFGSLLKKCSYWHLLFKIWML